MPTSAQSRSFMATWVTEAGSSPTRTTSSLTGTPAPTRSPTPARTSERMVAATALPSSVRATGLEHREELGGNLLLAAHHAGQVDDAVAGPRVEGVLDGVAVPGAQQL